MGFSTPYLLQQRPVMQLKITAYGRRLQPGS